ncbi:unnamed protein product, partial [Ixodes hexagonus]
QIVVDHTLYELYMQNSDDASARGAIASSVATHVAALSSIYMGTNFNGVGGFHFALRILRASVNDTSDCQGRTQSSNPYCSSILDGSLMLARLAEENNDPFCLSYIWTNRDFSGGLLGIAYIAFPQGMRPKWENRVP